VGILGSLPSPSAAKDILYSIREPADYLMTSEKLKILPLFIQQLARRETEKFII
jgi:hypothetical protein